MILDRRLPPSLVRRVVGCDAVTQTPAGPVRRYQLEDGRVFVAGGAAAVTIGLPYRFVLTGAWGRPARTDAGVVVDRLGDTEGAVVGRVEAV
jgi:hypothetical protein